MNILDLPFNRHIGLSLTRHKGEQVVCLDPQDIHKNHVGTIHAGAVYSLAEAGSGHCLLNNVDMATDKLLAVVRSAKVKYRTAAENQVIAIGQIEEDAAKKAVEQLKSKGRAFIEVHVDVIDCKSDETVFAADFSWFVSMNAEPGKQ